MAYTDVKGVQIGGQWEWQVIKNFACPEPYCKAAKGHCCTTKNGKNSSTAHASRWKAYRDWFYNR